ncbi:MAG: hypothetical protein QME65_00950 [Candidatus Omnitrophota bacterium]|nr:hypothetical protein [Candidatus Omnitrophota bacterium]
MDIHKLAHDVYETTRHWHLPLLVGLISSIRIAPKAGLGIRKSDLGDVPGDNILTKEILISLSSRRGP